MKFTLIIAGFGVALVAATTLCAADAVPAPQAHVWDLSRHMSWSPPLLEEKDITPAMRKSMETFSSLYPVRQAKPNGKGVPQDKFDQLVADVQRELPWNPATAEPRRPVELFNAKRKPAANEPKPVPIQDVLMPLCRRTLEAYRQANAAQSPILEDAYRRIVQCILAAGFLPPVPRDGWLGNGYEWRDWGSWFFEMDHTLPADERQRLAESVAWFAEGFHLYKEHPYANTDIQLNFLYNVFRAIGRMDNGPVKWQRLQLLRRGLDLSVTEGNFITADGGIVHHDGHHISYAGYSFGHAIAHQINFAKAGIIGPHTPTAVARYRAAATSWVFNSLRAEIPVPVQLRPAPMWEKDRAKGQKPGLGPEFAWRVAELTAAVNHTDPADDVEMARVAASCSGGDPAKVAAAWRPRVDAAFARPLEGHRPFPVMGISTHRRDDWMVMVRGANRFFRGGEVYADAGYPGAYLDRIMQGALFIYSKGREGRFPNSVDSGFRTEGFDPNLFPNVTAPMISNPDLAGRGNPDYMGSGAKQGGGAALGDNGIWAWNPGDVRKSAFFFGNRITLVTTGIKMKGDDVRTTLLQQVHENLAGEPMQIDGENISSDCNRALSPATAHTILDAMDLGYYIPAGNPPLRLRRGVQGYTYALKEQLTNNVTMESLGPIKNRAQLAKAIQFFKPIERPASVAWFEHGRNPQEARCEFTVLVRTTPAALAAFAAQMASDKKPFTLECGEQFHRMFDRATDTHALAAFAPVTLAAGSAVTAVNRPCTMMWQVERDSLALSIASTDLSDRTPFRITLAGRWKVRPGQSPDMTVESGENATTLILPYTNQSPRHCELQTIKFN